MVDLSGYGAEAAGRKCMSEKSNLEHLQAVLKKKDTPAPITGVIRETARYASGTPTVIIYNGKKRFVLPIEDGMKLIWERQGSPGTLTFDAALQKKFKVSMGNEVLVMLGSSKLFFGYIFTAQAKKDGIVSYTAYDQIRYLKNKDTLIYRNKTAGELVKQIAERVELRCGSLANTGHRMSAIEDNSTLLDMIQNALDETLLAKGQTYVLYDAVGKLRLVNVSNMKVNTCLVDADTGEDFDCKVSIDSDVYDQIKLIYENKDKGTYDLYVAKDSSKISKWGVLQYTDKIDDPDIGKQKSNMLLKLYNQEKRTLSVSGVIGNKSVRGGSLVPVILNLGNIKVSNYMMVEKVTHTFYNAQHKMDLVLSGGGFSV